MHSTHGLALVQLLTFIFRRSVEWMSLCFPRENGGKLFRFKRNTKNGGTIPSNRWLTTEVLLISSTSTLMHHAQYYNFVSVSAATMVSHTEFTVIVEQVMVIVSL